MVSNTKRVKKAVLPIIKSLDQQGFNVVVFAFSFPIIIPKRNTLFVTIAARKSPGYPGEYLFDVFYQNENNSERIYVDLMWI